MAWLPHSSPDEIYYPLRQLPRPGLSVSARTSGDPNLLQSVIRAAVSETDRDQPISFFQTMDAAMTQSLGARRIVASLTAGFAALALVLAAIGLYSVVAYAVTQRTAEIGIRMALGARPAQVLSLVMRSGLQLVVLGLVIGLFGATGTAKAIQTLLTNVRPFDPAVFAGVAAFFGLVGAAACLIPSLRAARIDPVVALADRRGGRRS